MLPSGPQRCGTAASFEAARVAFGAAWREYLPRRSEADFQAWRDQAAWTAEKFLIGVNACEEDRPLASVGLPFPTSAPIFAAAKTTFRAMHSDARNQSSCRAGLLHEIKHDGYRLLVQREGKRVRLFTRNGHDWTDRYPLVVEAALRNRRSSFVIDGEAVLLGVDLRLQRVAFPEA